MHLEQATDASHPWNKGRTIGQKAPFKSKEIWVIRTRLEMDGRARDLALFNLAIDSKLGAAIKSDSESMTSATAIA